jgi:hypothetical protein
MMELQGLVIEDDRFADGESLGHSSVERNRFELSYATCFNRSVDLYFSWRP